MQSWMGTSNSKIRYFASEGETLRSVWEFVLTDHCTLRKHLLYILTVDYHCFYVQRMETLFETLIQNNVSFISRSMPVSFP